MILSTLLTCFRLQEIQQYEMLPTTFNKRKNGENDKFCLDRVYISIPSRVQIHAINVVICT